MRTIKLTIEFDGANYAGWQTQPNGMAVQQVIEEAMQHPQIKARGMLPEVGGLLQFAPPLKMSGFDFAVNGPAPKVGADGTAILREAGYTEDEIGRLQKQGVI